MRLVNNVSVRGFRSIQAARLEGVGSLTALVGRNSSGKSNVLRALNLFFNDEVEPGKAFLLQRDFHSRPQARRKKQVQVDVDFALPPNFRFRKSLSGLKKVLGQVFTIRRTWSLDPHQAAVSETELIRDGAVIPDGEEYARQFLQLVTFRYIPNRTVPAALLREESRLIASSIFAKMHGASGAQGLLTSMRTAADKLLKRASESMERTGPPFTSPGVASPESLAELLSVSGFQALGFHKNVVRDEEWGSGNQAFFLYEVLQAVDTNYSRSFGWKQAAIWGVEEPESGLHRDLETRLADDFRSWCSDPERKVQIIQTTHSPVFSMAADVGVWVDIIDGASTLERTPVPRLVRDAESRGVSGWVQPILAFPTNPVVLVEGKIDSEVLSHVAALIGLDRIRFLALPELDAAEKQGGKDALTTYLKRHSGLLANRPSEYPLLVMFDWETPDDELEKARKAYGPNGAFAVLRMDAKHADPSVGRDFCGIERFYPRSIIKHGHEAGEFVVGEAKSGQLSISASQFSVAKQRLRPQILGTNKPEELVSLCAIVRDVETAVSTFASSQLKLPWLSVAK